MAQLIRSDFTPFPTHTGARARGCLTCSHFLGERSGGHVVCREGGGRQVIGQERNGCAYWMREPGADDE